MAAPDPLLTVYLDLERELGHVASLPGRVQRLARKARRLHDRQLYIWRWRASHIPDFAPPLPGQSGIGLGVRIGCTVLFTVGMLIAAIAHGGVAFVLVAALIAVPVVSVWWRERRIEPTPLVDLRTGTCHACGYDLTGLATNASLDQMGFELGARRCPECGVDWPDAPELRIDPRGDRDPLNLPLAEIARRLLRGRE